MPMFGQPLAPENFEGEIFHPIPNQKQTLLLHNPTHFP